MMFILVCRAAIACLILLMPLALPGHSQETTGTILGTLVDQTGAVLPAVKVVITSVDTGQVREVVTNNVGQYTASLPVGNYEISFLLPKFQPFTARRISLHVNDRLQVNGKLIVSGAVETLTVTAERLVQPTSAVQNLIQPLAVRELPLLTRTPVQLVTLVPGVSSDLREEACFCDQGNLDISINGARRSAVNWLLDGASNVNGWNNYTLVTTPSLEAIQEINVITSTYAAEWARNGGGVVNVVTKSGTNRFSGSVYEFLRNDVLNANSFFRNVAPFPQINSAPPRLRYNNFGYTLGGPALPNRKKLFFFFSEEWRRSSREKRPSEAPVPDPAWLTDPASPEYVPPEARDPNAVKLLTLWPAPNIPRTNYGTNYRTTITNELDTRQELLRVDYNVSPNWSVTGRYLHDRVDSLGEYLTGPDDAPGHRYQVGHLAVVEARHVKGRLLHEVSYQLSRHTLSRKDPLPARGDVGIVIPEIFPENAANLIPNVYVAGLSTLGGRQPWPREYLNHTLSGALAFQHGTHTLKTGGLIALEHMNSNLYPETTQGSFFFNSGGGFTGFQNFLRGNSGGACGEPCWYSETDIDPLNRFRSARYEAFAQDTWRIHPKVTVDFGLRYAFYTPLMDKSNMLFTFSPEAYDPAQAPTFADPEGNFLVSGTGNLFNGIRVAGKNSPYGRAIYAADKNNLQPRVGAAWDPNGAGRLVVRVGYGMYFDQTQVGMFAQTVQNSYYDPFRTDLAISNPALSNPGTGTVVKPFAVWTPVTFATSDPFAAPRWQHWNVGVQRRLYSRGMIDLGYVGGRGDRLLRYVDINQPQAATVAAVGGAAANTVRPFLGYDAIIMRETTAKSRYHGLVASFHHDAGRAGFAMVNYTFSRNKADATYDNDFLDNPQNPLDKEAEFAAARTDRTQIFTASYVYELPFARGEPTGWRKALLGGWQIAGITRIESGPAARLQVVNCNYGDWCFPAPLRPNQVRDPGAGDQKGLLWFNPAAFVPSPAGEYGNATVAPFRLPGRHQWDFAVSKNLSLGETARLQFRADLINAFNQTQFLDVNTYCVGTTTCDRPGTVFGQVTNARPPREIQLGVRLHW
jgi:Carboxypeptidase regulatory-like domain